MSVLLRWYAQKVDTSTVTALYAVYIIGKPLWLLAKLMELKECVILPLGGAFEDTGTIEKFRDGKETYFQMMF